LRIGEAPIYTLVYFSPTGNVRHLAKKLAKHLDPHPVEVLALESIDAEQLAGDKHLVLLYPIHGFNPPRNVNRFVGSLPAGLYDAASLIAVGCTTSWVNGAVSSDLRKALNKKGYAVVLDKVMAMPLTFVTSFPDEMAGELVAEAGKEMEEIALSLVEGRETELRVRARSRLLHSVGKAEHFAARLFGLELKAGDDCTSCGTCWDNCPVKNIERGKNDRPKFGFECLMCMRCVYNCPEKTIQPRISRFLPIKDGYSVSKYVEE
jgi:ferredoxin/flavodoxin